MGLVYTPWRKEMHGSGVEYRHTTTRSGEIGIRVDDGRVNSFFREWNGATYTLYRDLRDGTCYAKVMDGSKQRDMKMQELDSLVGVFIRHLGDFEDARTGCLAIPLVFSVIAANRESEERKALNPGGALDRYSRPIYVQLTEAQKH